MLGQLHSIIIKQRFLAAPCLFLMIAMGCSSPRASLEDEKTKEDMFRKERKLPLADYEATLDPVKYDQEVEVVEKTHIEEQKQRLPLEIPKDSLIVYEEIGQGFRIQVFSSSGVDEANLMKSITMEKFTDDSVYVVYDAPVYKVRVGDFVNRYEADQRLPDFIEKGYRDAWIVPDRIIQRKFVRISLPK